MVEIIKSKLNNKSGESITEVLVALLISSLGLLLLAGMITSTNRIVSRSKEATRNYIEQNNALVEQGTSSETETGTVSFYRGDSTKLTLTKLTYSSDETIGVTYYTNEQTGSTPVTAYKKTEGTGGS